MIDEKELLKTDEKFLNPFDHHVSKRGIDSFHDLHKHEILSNYPEYTEDIH